MSETRWKCKICGTVANGKYVLQKLGCQHPEQSHEWELSNGDPLTAAPVAPAGRTSDTSCKAGSTSQDGAGAATKFKVGDKVQYGNDEFVVMAINGDMLIDENGNWADASKCSVPQQPTDQQRSDAVTPRPLNETELSELRERLEYGDLSDGGKIFAEQVFDVLKAYGYQSAAIAERDATIAELRAEVDRTTKIAAQFARDHSTLETIRGDHAQEIAALQALVKHLETTTTMRNEP